MTQQSNNSAAPVAASAMSFDLVSHLYRQRAFSLQTFGPGDRQKGVVAHIRKELAEIEEKPTDLTEWIDVAILAFDGAWRAGYSPEAIVAALAAKQAKNEGRTWPDWRTVPTDVPIEHDRTGEALSALAESDAELIGAGGPFKVGDRVVYRNYEDGKDCYGNPAKRGNAGGVNRPNTDAQSAQYEYHAGPGATSSKPVSLLDKWRAMQAAFLDTELGATAKNVFGLLLDHRNGQTGQCNPSIARLAEKLGVGRHAVMRAIKELEGRGWLSARRTQGERTDYVLRFPGTVTYIDGQEVYAKDWSVGEPSGYLLASELELVNAAPAEPPAPEAERSWYPDDRAWIEHGGGACPVDDDLVVEVLLRHERAKQRYYPLADCARSLSWVHQQVDGDVVAYLTEDAR